ncbi:hypothetical protein GCM10022200_07740 [Microbacterium awajiense]|uniref:TadE-like domain-containing protein n=1 Tax=Microbacterium awajiense TaxID=415214 RepID=A0ABP7A9V1_9MICO
MRALRLDDDTGSSPVEFVLVGALLTVLTLAVMQLGLAVYVRNVVHDAAVDGAYHAALADTAPAEGAERARTVIARTVGEGYVESAAARESTQAGHPVVEVTVRATLPLAGLWGLPGMLEVTAHAPLESLAASG